MVLLAHMQYELGFDNKSFENRGMVFYKIRIEIHTQS
jgi:hypothetical protein